MTATASAGRKSAPYHLKLVSGRSPGKDSAGREITPPPEFTRERPAKPDLSADASWLWDQVVEQMTTVGLLKPLDAASLEVMCETFARWRGATRDRRQHGALGKNSQGVVTAPWVGIEERASKEFRAWCAEYGITPAAEKNLRSDENGDGADENPF